MNDLISRQALRDAMYHEAFETDTEMQRWDSGCWIRYKLFENVIDNMPSAERKRGKWIDLIIKDDIIVEKCSACGYLKYVYGRPNYCPCCGARMRERKEDDTHN